MKNKIDIISSFSKDIINKNNEISVHNWGPAFFIENTFKNKLNYKNLTKTNYFEIEIYVNNNWETWKIINKKIKIINFYINTENLIISTIFDEIKLNDFKFINLKNIFIDLQWFSRYYKKINYSKYFIWKNLFIKWTNEEINKLSKNFYNKIIKNNLLIITNGWNKLEYFYKWTKYYKEIEKINNLKNTVWAWDTFFANFIYYYLKWIDIKNSIINANKQTSLFLKNK